MNLLFPAAAGKGGEAAEIFKQGIFTFMLEPGVSLKKLSGRLSLGKMERISNLNKDNLPSSLNEEQKELFWKFYVIFRRVEDLLNMHPRKLENLNIRVYPDLKKAEITARKKLNHNTAAFYLHEEKTIYISARKCDEFVLAHELAHAVICNFFLIVPPVNTQEILAMYCDSHLKDEADYVDKILKGR